MSRRFVQAATYTHAGRRRSNQDAVLALDLAPDAQLLVVADGMGGHSAGEIASALAVDVLARTLGDGADLPVAVAAANEAVHAEAARTAGYQGMGTTLVAVLRRAQSYLVANVGDSRAYRIDSKSIVQLTHDHSVVAEALREGSMSQEEAVRSPWRHALTRAVGTESQLDADIFGPFPIYPPHIVLLCSDGLHGTLAAETIHDYLLGTEDSEAAVQSLGALAYRNGSTDNITVAALEFGRLPRREPDVTVPLPIARQAKGSSKVGAGNRRDTDSS